MRSVAVLSLATAALAAPSLMERAPAGCQSSFDGEFEVSVFKPAPKRDLEKRACSGKDGALLLTLKDGVLMDDKKRTGYIADNRQFQFDGPVQKGAIITSGFSVCSNGSLALGDSTVWYQCLSGDFNNIYDRHWAPQCEQVILVSKSCADGDAGGAAGQTGDGQVQATTAVTQIGDGQVQAPTNAPVITQIGDGQIQAPSNAPVMPTGAPVTQIGDGQVQAPTSAPVASSGAPVTQIGDGQVQAPTSAPVASSGAPVTQIGDGQVQAPTSAPVATGAPVTQIGDGQVQAPTSVGTIMPTIVPSPSVSMLPPSAGSQILPGSFALIVAALGAVFAL